MEMLAILGGRRIIFVVIYLLFGGRRINFFVKHGARRWGTLKNEDPEEGVSG